MVQNITAHDLIVGDYVPELGGNVVTIRESVRPGTGEVAALFVTTAGVAGDETHLVRLDQVMLAHLA
jgi:hypothetical protein